MRLDVGIGRGQQAHPERPAGRDPGGRLGEPEALAQEVGAGQVRAEVEVAEGEPRPADAVLAQFGAHALRLAGPAPAARGVVDTGERVHDRVEVGGDAHARHPHVVADVDDRRDLIGGCRGSPHSEQKPSAADAARENRDAHGSTLAAATPGQLSGCG
jgi:hypothetical protein